MVPLLDLLNQRSDADLTVKVRAGHLEFICDAGVKAGEQLWNNYGAKANDELLLHYGFAVEDNPCDSVQLALAPKEEKSVAKDAPKVLRLTPKGIPEEVI